LIVYSKIVSSSKRSALKKTMTIIKSLIIPRIERQYTQKYIADVFWRQHIAKVSSITLIPYSKMYNTAYITIGEWSDTEIAYNFIQRVNNLYKEARIVHRDDEWWPIQLNTHNNRNICIGSYTLVFDSEYFKCDEPVTEPCTEDEDEDEDEEDSFEFNVTRPIQGLKNDHYTVDEAHKRICVLIQQMDEVLAPVKSYKQMTSFFELKEELIHLQNELRIHKSINNSSNVTQRTVRFAPLPVL